MNPAPLDEESLLPQTPADIVSESWSALKSLRNIRRNVRGKLVGIVLLTTSLVLLLSGLIVIAHDLHVYRASWAADLATEADILALSTAPALAFDNQETAARNLQALQAKQSIVAAALYRPDGSLYAQFVRSGEAPPPQKPVITNGMTMLGERVEFAQPIRYNDELLGTIYLRARYDVVGRISAYTGIFVLVIALGLLLALALSASLQRSVTQPLEAIADVCRQIVHRHDYSLRVTTSTADEIGVVVQALNRMLQEIQTRTDALEQTNADLRSEIAVRKAAELARLQSEQELRNSEKVYRAIGETIDFGIWLSDADGRCHYISESFLRLTGMTMEQCRVEGWACALHPDDAEATVAAWRECVRNEQSWYRELRIRGADGRYHPVLGRGVPIRGDDGVIYAWAGLNLDISLLKQTEEALRLADRRKDEFLATLAHELRNPLAPIRFAARLLSSPKATEPQRQWGREVIARQVEHMALLLDDLLDVSRITRGKLELRPAPVGLQELIATAAETARPLIEEKHHQLEIRLPAQPVVLNVDALRISQTLSNLLTNAAKFTNTGGHICLTAEVDSEGLHISVADDGIGLAPEAMAQVFEMFSQVETALTRGHGGLGIGLALARGLIGLHGGTVEASSEGLGRGSRFTIHLPVDVLLPGTRQLAQTAASATESDEANATGIRIVVADDNRDATDTLAILLQQSGYEVTAAYSGHEALELVVQLKPQVAILDIGMPDMTGYEVAERIRAQPWGAQVRLIALTGWGQEHDIGRARQAGFDCHFRKPVSADEVVAFISGNTGALQGQK